MPTTSRVAYDDRIDRRATLEELRLCDMFRRRFGKRQRGRPDADEGGRDKAQYGSPLQAAVSAHDRPPARIVRGAEANQIGYCRRHRRTLES